MNSRALFMMPSHPSKLILSKYNEENKYNYDNFDNNNLVNLLVFGFNVLD